MLILESVGACSRELLWIRSVQRNQSEDTGLVLLVSCVSGKMTVVVVNSRPWCLNDAEPRRDTYKVRRAWIRHTEEFLAQLEAAPDLGVPCPEHSITR